MPFTWTGFYAGVNAGYRWGTQAIGLTDVNTSFVETTGVNSIAGNPRGFIGGGQLGYNWQAGRAVYGIEGDFDGESVKRDETIGAIVGVARTFSGSQKLDWLATLRGRVGYTPMDRALLYVTGGLAVGHASASASLTTNAGCLIGVCIVGPSTSKTMAGWTIGGGAEYAVAGNWSVKAEYLHYDLGKINTTAQDLTPGFAPNFPTLNGSVTISGNVARLGVNYKFN